MKMARYAATAEHYEASEAGRSAGLRLRPATLKYSAQVFGSHICEKKADVGHRQDQYVRRRPNCSLRMGWALRITPKVVEVVPEGTLAPGVPRLTMLKRSEE